MHHICFHIMVGAHVRKRLYPFTHGCLTRARAIRKAIEETIVSTPAVKGFHELKVRRSGPFVFVEVHVEVDGGISVKNAHAIGDEVEDRIKKRFKEVDSITIHIGMVHEKEDG